FNTGSHTGDMDNARTSWWRAFDDYGVDLVLNGHDHNYQRTYPINLKASPVGTPVAQYGSNTGQGRLQIISGGAGAGLYSQNTGSADAWSIAKFDQTYNYVYVSVQGCKMVITDYDQTNTLVETLTLDKTTSPSCTTTSISEVKNPAGILNISPNPMEGSFLLHYASDKTGEVLVKIYDVNGKEVLSQKVIKTGNVLELPYDLSGRAKGIYSVAVILGDEKETSTIILK
ncbi:MAG TPA: T9SS type A sorting domain-containing protein, partial [Bacteroidia bacterium]|nr:T9SS type A sorting domain-containing protein [Bacteroidia bacterium]